MQPGRQSGSLGRRLYMFAQIADLWQPQGVVATRRCCWGMQHLDSFISCFRSPFPLSLSHSPRCGLYFCQLICSLRFSLSLSLSPFPFLSELRAKVLIKISPTTATTTAAERQTIRGVVQRGGVAGSATFGRKQQSSNVLLSDSCHSLSDQAIIII